MPETGTWPALFRQTQLNIKQATCPKQAPTQRCLYNENRATWTRINQAPKHQQHGMGTATRPHAHKWACITLGHSRQHKLSHLPIQRNMNVVYILGQFHGTCPWRGNKLGRFGHSKLSRIIAAAALLSKTFQRHPTIKTFVRFGHTRINRLDKHVS